MFNPFTDLTFMEYLIFCWIVMFLTVLTIGMIIYLFF